MKFYFYFFKILSQVACLQAQLMQAKAQLAQNFIDQSRNIENNNQWVGVNSVINGASGANMPNLYLNNNYVNYPISPQSSLDSVDQNGSDLIMNAHQEIQSGRPSSEDFLVHQACSKKRPNNGDLGELQALALRMMRN